MQEGKNSGSQNTGAGERMDDFLDSAAHLREDAPVCFIHIPRTGASGVEKMLDTFYAPQEIFSCKGAPEFLTNPELLQQYWLFRGRFSCNLRKIVKKRLRYLTLLRDPVQRALSHYAAVMNDEGHYLHGRARQLKNFESYLNDPETRPTVANFQLRAIAFDVDPLDVSVVDSSDDHILERRLDTTPFNLSEQQLLEQAKERLRRFCMVGITERYADSIRLMCELFEWPLPAWIASDKVNASHHKREPIEEFLLEQLQGANQAEIALYAYARTLFEEAFHYAKLTRPSFDAFVSYASNQEDVILSRVFDDVDNGSYIDVGAQDPVGDSVTKALYDRGWRGINIEPVERYYQRLQEERSDETNIQAVVGARPGRTTFYEVEDTGLSTVSKIAAEGYEAQGFTVRRQSVAVRTLTEICETYAVNAPHLLKIDAEGSEAEILRGLDLQKVRPWVVVVEATVPNSPEPNFNHWETLIQDQGYQCVYKDGLNRFYLAAERSALRVHFENPPNVFDRFVRFSEVLLREQFRKATVHYRIALRELDRVRKHADLQREASAVERRNIVKQIGALTTSLVTAEAFAKSLESEYEQGRAETVKQVAALTASLATAEAYAKSLELEREGVRAEAAKRVAVLTASLATAEAYAKSLELERERVRAEVGKQVAALTTSIATAEAYAKSLEESRQRVESEMAVQIESLTASRTTAKALEEELEQLRESASAEVTSHAVEREQLLSQREKTAAKLDSYRNHWVFRILKHPK
jgi:FkbM family methyltransferase